MATITEAGLQLTAVTRRPAGSTAPPGARGRQRMIQLDVLRGIAILLVINRHHLLNAGSSGILRPVAEPLYRMGWSGVDLFFVLSGFLIGGLLFQELRENGSLNIRRFLIRRIFKIWPSYYLYIAYVFVLLHWTHTLYRPYSTNSIIPNLLHVQNYTIAPRTHTWSLAVEEHFYLALPFLLALIAGRRAWKGRELGYLPWIAGAIAGTCLLLRFRESFHHPWAVNTHFFPSHLRIDSLFFGVLIAYFYHYRAETLSRLAQHRRAILIAGLILILPTAVLDYRGRFMSVMGLTLVYVGYGCILFAVVYTQIGVGVAGRLLGSLPARCIAFIGVYSYPIYLWHIDYPLEPLQHLAKLGFLSGLPGSARWLVYMTMDIALATVVGVIMGRLVEKPALKLRDRLFPSRIDPLAH